MPVVKLAVQPYEAPFFPPNLQWFPICRGDEKAGDLLAAFELLQVKGIFDLTLNCLRYDSFCRRCCPSMYRKPAISS